MTLNLAAKVESHSGCLALSIEFIVLIKKNSQTGKKELHINNKMQEKSEFFPKNLAYILFSKKVFFVPQKKRYGEKY